MGPVPDLSEEAAEWESAGAEVVAAQTEGEARRRTLFAKLAGLRRRVALANPLLDFSSIIFLAHNKQARGDVHMVDQYLGFNAEKRGGVYVLERAFAAQPRVRSVLAHRRVEKGRLAGRELEDRGGFVSLDLDYDGRTILFAFSEAQWQLPAGACDANYWTALDARAAGSRPAPCALRFPAGGLLPCFQGPR